MDEDSKIVVKRGGKLIIDGGNTAVLATDVQTSYPPEAWDLYISLIGKSPYLSDTVMKSAVKKENVLPPELVTDVLVANPQSAKSDKVLIEIENRTIPLTDEMKEEIMLNWYVTGAKESLESKLTAYRAERGKALNDLIRYFRNDTVDPSPADSIIAILQQENTLPAKYTLVYEYINKGDMSEAENLMNQIPVMFALNEFEQSEYNDNLTFFSIIKQLKEQGKNLWQADSVQLLTLYNIAYNDTKAGAFARNALICNDTLTYEEEILYPSFMKSSPVIPIPAQKPADKNTISVYPNPAKGYFIVRYELDNSYADALIEISDMTGRQVMQFAASTARDYLVVPVKDLNSGVYIVKLILNGKTAGTKKVKIQN